MVRRRWGGGTLGALTAGMVLIGLAALPLYGCAPSAASGADEADSLALSGSRSNVGTGGAASGEQAVSVPAGAISASASAEKAAVPAPIVPAPIVPPVTSATSPALAAAAPLTSTLASSAAPAASTPTVVASVQTPVLKGLHGSGMASTARKLNPVMIRALKQFQIASAAFPDFCNQWSHKLSMRERDNLKNIKWVVRNGLETGSYVAYGPVDSCTCKEASNGVAVGVLTYKEYDYSLTGKSIEDARHATPHTDSVVPTREIFAYDRGKWFW